MGVQNSGYVYLKKISNEGENIMFGIQITPGHLILMAIGIVLYDAIFTWPVSDDGAKWWFARLQGWLKLAIYAGFLAIVVFVVYTPWPWNLVLVLSIAACAFFVSMWLKRKTPTTPARTETPTHTPPATPTA